MAETVIADLTFHDLRHDFAHRVRGRVRRVPVDELPSSSLPLKVPE